MWIVRLALKRPYTVAAFCSLILLMGFISIKAMSTDVLPAIDIPVAVVIWNYTGMTAQDMERRVVLPSERGISTSVDAVEHIESQSTPSVGLIKVFFTQGSDIGGAIAQITAASMSSLRIMPPGMQPPIILRYNASNVPVAQLTLTSPTMNSQEVYDYGLNFLRLRLFTVPGLVTPAPYGGSVRQVEIDVDPTRLAAKGLSPQDVVNAVTNSNVILPAGTARIGHTEYNVDINGSPATIAEFNAIPVKVVNGTTVFLGDVATAHDGYGIQQNIVRINGQRSTYLTILKKSNASTIAVVDAARDLIPDLKAAAPNGMEMKIDFDQSVFVRAAINGVLREGLISIVLVSLMVFGFLGSWRSVIIVVTSIPLAIFCSIIGLMLGGQSLNLMTLGGLALAIGMLVDDATVEIENINRNRNLGKPLLRAILDGARQIATPALAATLTICIVFFPVVMLTGPAKFLFTPLALSVAMAMLASYVLSRTLVPTLAHMLLDKEEIEEDVKKKPKNQLTRFQRFNVRRDELFDKFKDKYGSLLEALLAHRAATLIGFGGLVAAVIFLPGVAGSDFFPNVDTGQMKFHFRAPVGTRIEDTERLIAQVEGIVHGIIPAEELDTINANIGQPLFYNLGFVASDNAGGYDADVTIALKEKHHPSNTYIRKIREEIPAKLPGSTVYFQAADVISQVLNFGLPAPIDVQIQGQDQDATYEVARKLADQVRRIPGTADVRIAQVFNYPAMDINVDRQQAAQLGLTQHDVAASVLTALASSSLLAPSFWVSPKNNVSYAVNVMEPLQLVSSLDDLEATPLTGATTPTSTDPLSVSAPYLGSISTMQLGRDRSSINHYTVQPIVEVQTGVDGRDLGGVAADVQKAVDNLKDLPKGSHITIRGQSDSMKTSFRSLALGLIVAILLVYMLMVVLFQSFLDPLIIMFALPGALVGIMWMLVITGTTINVESLMGSIMSVGIAVSNSILLVSFANEVRVEKDLDAMAAAIEAGKTRLRPVLMTAIAMFLGMIPMALAMGEGGEQNAPLGRAVIGGLLVATMTTLLIVPVMYSLLRRGDLTKGELDDAVQQASDEGEKELEDKKHEKDGDKPDRHDDGDGKKRNDKNNEHDSPERDRAAKKPEDAHGHA